MSDSIWCSIKKFASSVLDTIEDLVEPNYLDYDDISENDYVDIDETMLPELELENAININVETTDPNPVVRIDWSVITESKYDHDAEMRFLKEAAYYAWINAGYPEGRDLEFWLQAERELYGYTLGEMNEAYDDYDKGSHEYSSWSSKEYFAPSKECLFKPIDLSNERP